MGATKFKEERRLADYMPVMPQSRLRSDAHRRTALAAWWLLTLALVPAFLFLAPPSRG